MADGFAKIGDLYLSSSVGDIFNAKIKEMLGHKTEAFNWLMKHERKQMCIDRITKEVRETEWTTPWLLDGPKRRQFIEDCAVMFMSVSLKHAEEQAMTQGQKNLLNKEHDRLKNVEAEFNELNNEKDKFFVTR